MKAEVRALNVWLGLGAAQACSRQGLMQEQGRDPRASETDQNLISGLGLL
jgi:hypothetical protein